MYFQRNQRDIKLLTLEKNERKQANLPRDSPKRDFFVTTAKIGSMSKAEKIDSNRWGVLNHIILVGQTGFLVV